MKKLSLIYASFCLLSVSVAIADSDMDVSKISCKEFISGSKDQIGTVITWLEGYYTKKGSPPIMYEAKTMKDAKGLSDYCNSHPEHSLIKAAEMVMQIK